AEVGVQVLQQVVPVRHRVPHGREGGGAQAELAGAVHHLDAGVLGGQFVGQPAGAVGRVVVDHQHVRVRGVGVDVGDQRGQVVPLVVGGEGNEQAGRIWGHRT